MGKILENGYAYVKEVLDGNFFHIPTMQRGYRWSEKNVRQLLDDIYEDKLIRSVGDEEADNELISEKRKSVFNFNSEKKIDAEDPAKDPYCIQPLVLCHKEGEAEDHYDVIDGQQRLTTIVIILKAMKAVYPELDIPTVSLKYESRKGSEDYLNNSLGNASVDKSNIDFEYMQNSYDTAKVFFEEISAGLNGYPRKRYFQYLLDVLMLNTRFIWYLVDGSNSHVVFQNFNSGKLDLTDSELVKALFMDASGYSSKNIDDKRIVISEKWDEIENQLHDADFWAFVPHAKQYEQGDYDTRMDVIFEFLIMKSHLDSGMSLQEYLVYRKDNAMDRYIFTEMSNYIEGERKKNDKQPDDKKLNDDDLMKKCWYDVRKIYLGLSDLYQRDTIGKNDNKIYNMAGLYINLKNRVDNNVDNYNTQNEFLFLEVYHALSKVMEAPRSGKGNRLDKLKDLIRKELGFENITDRAGLEKKIKSIRHSYANEDNIIKNADIIVKTLLAYNIGLLNRTEGMGQRFAFRTFAELKWEREHIFASNIKEEKNGKNGLDTDEERRAALGILADDHGQDATKNEFVEYILDMYFPDHQNSGVDYKGQKLDFKDDKVLRDYFESNLRYDEKESPAVMLSRALRARSDSKGMLEYYDLIDRIIQALNCDDKNVELKHNLLYGILMELGKDFYKKEYVNVEGEICGQQKDQNDPAVTDYHFKIDAFEARNVSKATFLVSSVEEKYREYLRKLYMKDPVGNDNADDYIVMTGNEITGWPELEKAFYRCITTLNNNIDEFFKDRFARLLCDNTMGNMTLLTGGKQTTDAESQNQTVSDKSYKLKKQDVHGFIKEGQFVPLGTMMVFSDMYNEGANSANFWLPDSRKKYLNDMIDTLNDFLIS